MSKFFTRVLFAILAISLLGASNGASAARTCTPTGFMRDGINLTAAQIGGQVVTPLDATGCDIGVYYGAGGGGTVRGTEIWGARYFGVVANGSNVDLTNTRVHDIGNVPFDGTQHGVAIYYTDGGGGVIDGNTVYGYQKGGIVLNGTGTAADVTNNIVTGLGPVNYIAQNGIQISRGAVALVRGNSISDNFYTGTAGVGPNPGGQNPPGWEYYSVGLLLYQAGDGTKASMNHFSGNQHNLAMVP